jgi:hypothetical protein
MSDGFVPLCDNLTFSGDRGLELFNLSNLPVNVSVITLGYTGHLAHTVALKYLMMILCIHKPDCSTYYLFCQISQLMPKV